MENNKNRDLFYEFINSPKQRGITNEELKNSIDVIVSSCDDQYKIYVEIVEDVVIKAKFEGEGCAISFASVEALLRIVVGKKKNEIKEILDKYESFIDDKIESMNIKELNVFSIVQLHVSRRKCAKAPINAIRKAIK